MPSRRRVDAPHGIDMMAACRADALSKVYGRRDTAVHALREITLSIPSQAFTAIMGPSGSGKSTLLHCLAALDTPTSGRVYLGQTELTSLSRRQQAQVRRDRIGFVFQSFNLVPTLDAIENITLPQLLAGRRPDKDWLEYVVAQIGLGDRLHHRPSQLSGGQQQRVALARALAGRPEVIFADEPTGNLDTRASREMLALLRSAVDDFRQTVVTVTHDPAIAGYADQVLFFTDGQVVDQVLQPETSLVLEHLQYLDSSTSAHVSPRGQLHASTQSDGQHTMRSRRRRRADETGPGRPMVGSDDEVEVARQERWLQRIREQFEAEHESAEGPGTHAGHLADDSAPLYDGNGAHVGAANGVPAAQPARNGRAYGRYEAHSGFEPDARNGHHSNGHHPATGHPEDDPVVVDGVVDDDSGWLPAERSWLTGDPDSSPGHTGTQDTWSQADPYTGSPAQGPVSQADQRHTSDWEAESRTQRWDAAPVDTGQQAVWPADDQATSTWSLPTPGPTGADSAPLQDPGWRDAQGADPSPDVWSDPDPAAHEEWAEITPSQPPAPTWGAPQPQPRDGWHDPVPEPETGTQRAWQPADDADPSANGRRNGTRPRDVGYDDAPHTSYDSAPHTSYEEHYGSYGGGAEPVQTGGGTIGWSVGATGGDEGGGEQRGWDDDVEVVAEPEPLDIWAPAEEETWAPPADEETWTPPADEETWTPAHPPPTHTHAFGADPSQTGPFETVVPAPPDADRTASWSADPSPPVDDPYRPEPQPDRRYTGTTTDPFEALQSLQSQLNRLGGNGRRPPRRYEG